MKKIIVFLIVCLIVFSCSKDNIAIDIVIGKWQPIEIYEADMQLELPLCVSHMFTEYKRDQTFYSGFLNSNNLPEDCKNIDFALGWTWRNLGNNKYHIKLNQEAEQVYFITKRDQNLVVEIPGQNTIIIYKPI